MTKKDATPKAGAEGATPATDKTPIAAAVETPATPPLNPRLAAMAEMGKRIEAEREDDREDDEQSRTAYIGSLEDALAADAQANPLPDPDDEQAVKPNNDGIQNENVPQAEAPVVSTDPHAPVRGDDGIWRMKVKVNGTEQLVPISEAATHYQKDVAGNEKLKRAAERERQIAAREQAVAERERRSSQSTQPSKKDVAKLGDAEKAFVASIYSGDESSVEGAISKYREALTEQITADLQAGTPVQAQIDPAQIADQVERLIDFKASKARFTSAYSDVLADPVLTQIADQESERLLREEPDLSFDDHFKKAGDHARSWMEQRAKVMGFVPKEQAQAPEQTRVERKRQTASSPAGTSRAPKPQQPPVTHSSVIADIKRARGQMV